jgi:hypothetical protein
VTIVATEPPASEGEENSNDQDQSGNQGNAESTPDLPDGDLAMAEPSDGPPQGAAEQPYRITGAGGAGKPGLARDGKPNTAWATTDAEAEANVWFDLGAKRPVIAVRWLQARTGGAVEVQLSTDRKHWKTVGRGGDVAPGTWQTLEVKGVARYVRFRYVGADGPTRLGFLAEVEVYGPKTAADESEETLTLPAVDAVGEVSQTVRTDAKKANTKAAKKRAYHRPDGGEPNGHWQVNNRTKDHHPAKAKQDGSRRHSGHRRGTDNPTGNPPPTDSGQEPQVADSPTEEVGPDEP